MQNSISVFLIFEVSIVSFSRAGKIYITINLMLLNQIKAAEWPAKIPTIDLPREIKAQLQEEGILSPHKGHTLNTQLG